MGLLGFIGIGNKDKSVTKSQLDIVNSSVFNMVSKTKNVQANTINVGQDMKVSGIKSMGCTLRISQRFNGEIKILSQFDKETATELMNDVMNDLEKKLKQETDQETGFMNMIPNSSEKVTDTMTSIRNEVTKNITHEFINELSNKIVVNQKLVVENLVMDPAGFGLFEKFGTPPPTDFIMEVVREKLVCEIDQDVQLKVVSEQIGSEVANIIATNKTATEFAEEIEQATKQKSQGVGEAVGDAAEGIGSGVGTAATGVGAGVGGAAEGIGAGLGNVFGAGSAPSIASAVVSCIMVIAVGAFAMSPAGQNAAMAASKGG